MAKFKITKEQAKLLGLVSENSVKKVKITKEQYNRIFASGLLNESEVNGGLDRVDSNFKKAFSGKKIENLKSVSEDDFKITKPNKSVPKLNLEGNNDLTRETQSLIKYLYRKSDELSPFWEENGLTYDDICQQLTSKGIIVSKDGRYELSKKLGDSQTAIKALENELSSMLPNNDTKEDELEESDWFDNHPDHPANQPEPEYVEGHKASKHVLKLEGNNMELAIFKDAKGEKYIFNIDSVDESDVDDYANREIVGREPDGDGGVDIEYADWSLYEDPEAINEYVNDNIDKFTKGVGYDAFYDGIDIVKLDDELREELTRIFDKDKNFISLLGGVNENYDDVLNGFKDSFKKDENKPQIEKTDIITKLADLRQKELARREKEKQDLAKRSGDVEETTSAASSGAFTGPFNGDVIKKPIIDVPVVGEAMELGKGYTHFAIFKADNKIADGWDYSSLYDKYEKNYDNVSVLHYSKQDIKDNFPENKPSDFKVVTRKSLEKKGIDPSDTNNWYKIDVNETLTTAGAGNFQYDTPGGLTMDLGKSNPKSKAEKVPQWAGGSFVKQPECSKPNNNKAAQNGGCNSGASSLKTVSSKGSINAPSLGENEIYEMVSKKTGRSIDEVKSIVKGKKD